jgi:hypothetical protein
VPDTVDDLLRALARDPEPGATRAVLALIGLDLATLAANVPKLVALVHHPAAAHRQSVVHRLAAAGLHDAVAPHVPALPPLLEDPEPEVRETVAYLLSGHPAHAAVTLPALLARWAVETDSRTRASLLLAVCALDRAAGQPLLRAAGREAAAVRAAAGLAMTWWPPAAGRWPQRLTEAVVDAFRDGDPLAGGAWTADARAEITRRFVHPGRAPRAMLELLAHSPSRDVRRGIPFTIGDLNRRSRRAPARFVPMLAPLLDDPDGEVRGFAAAAVRDSGAAAALVADRLADPAKGEYALDALMWIDDPRWRTVLAEAWRRDRTGMERTARVLRESAPPFDPLLCAALTHRVDVAGREEFGHAEIGWLAGQLGAWGAAAAAALGPLTAALTHENTRDRVVSGRLCRAIADIGTASESATREIRACVERGFRPYDRAQAALALWQLTGAAEPLLRLVTATLAATGEDHDPFLFTLLPPLGEAARPVLPALREQLRRHPERLRTNTAIAGILYELDGDRTGILPALAAALADATPPAQAVTLVEELGLTTLLPRLRELQETRVGWLKVLVAGARHRLGDASTDEVVRAVLPPPAGFEYWHHYAASRAVELVVRLHATQAADRLEAYLATDKRIRFGSQNDLIRDDERLQAQLRAALATL